MEKVALVTGGSRGIGAQICLHFLQAGYHVIAVDIDADRLNDWV